MPAPTSATPTIVGTCIHALSTVTTLAADGSHHDLRVNELKTGQYVLAAGASHALTFSEVVGIPHSSSQENFVKVSTW